MNAVAYFLRALGQTCVKGSGVSMMWVSLLHYVRGWRYKNKFCGLNQRRSAGQQVREDVRLTHTHTHTHSYEIALPHPYREQMRLCCAFLKAKRGRRERYAPWNVQVSTSF